MVYGFVAICVGLVILLGLLRWLGKDQRNIDSEKRKELRRLDIEYGQKNEVDDPNRRNH